ncbi:hypothetical protein GLOIN_2v1473489 [Rhizophagus irregularis DAOM 181602=DAOM 197198]|uniref:Uncharacterized protein n=3 Tax=Rhizophagus irregularis TaxID=588596 RepID=A0A015MKR8_RHIIW|nr:hypothetical protein GLOIN_2v1473489 [Rhizophagus irregularis DAOM 181602=DAOM 197198]EXX67453.1 hypothetical protein RirG_114200 [Rhizophagus irregularis DAOM 197198w]POG77929.1 hypothetical protein GLOIN_2v1473489 [Rhizophagus irregularis DAOM 181602=DAOM 197198]CAG8693823.1 4026_t:CDS:1 [Rhizophagus irregularis]|eukprot:XP_025184795.1 hypothetical protein GLOIN_2v1473489 [Rhizophagus irregularis DAOM 181602=DAOM 197198]
MSNFTALQPTTTIQQSNLSISQVIQMNECKFFHLDDGNFYHVTCQIILRGSILDDHDYDHGFFYHGSTINYYVKCKLFSHPLIIKILNKEIYGIDIDMNNFERKKELSLDQKLILEQDLKQILPFYLTQNHIPKSEMRIDPNINMNPIQRRNTEQMISNQNNFDNGNHGFYQNDVVDYTYNVTQPQQQQIDSNNVSSFNRNSSSFHRSIGNNVMTTDNQNNVNEGYIHNDIHPQQQVDFNNISPPMRPVYNNYRNTNSSNENIENNNQGSHQNRVEDTQQADPNNFPQRQIPERETMPDYNRNTNSLQNDVLAYDVSITDNNFDHRDTRSAYPQQQVDLYTPAERMTTQAISVTNDNQIYDDNSVSYNDNHDVTN